MRRVILDYLRKQLEDHDIVEFGAPDWGTGNGYRCECAACVKISPYLDVRIWELHLWLAGELRKSDPGKFLMLPAYGNTWRVAPGMKKGDIPDNVIIELSSDMGPLESDHPGVDPKAYKGNLAPGPRPGWMKVHDRFSVYNYFWMPYYADGPGPKGSIAQLVYSFKRYKELGVNMLYYCSRPVNWGLEGIQYYVDHRLRMDIDTDVGAVLDEYFTMFYGPAAAGMRAFFDHVEEVQNSTGWKVKEVGWLRYGADTVEVYTKRWTKERADKALALLAKAEEAAGEDEPVFAARVSLSRASMEWVAHTAEVCRLWLGYQGEKSEKRKKAWGDAVKRRDEFIDAHVAKIESGHWRRLGLPDPLVGTSRKHSVREELGHRTWGCFRGPFEVGR